MAKTKRIPGRNQVKTRDTWDLTPLFKSDAAWERAYKRLQKEVARYETFRGKLKKSPAVLHACCAFDFGFQQKMERLANYAFLKSAEDVGDGRYQAMMAKYMRLATRAEEAASFIPPEIRSIPKTTMAKFLRARVLAPYRYHLERLLRYRPHILSTKEERLLAMQGEVTQTPSNAFGQLTDVDFDFGFVTNETGERIELTQSSLITLYESPKRAVRKRAFDKFYAVYEAHGHTLAALLNGAVLQDVYEARARNHPSAREAALFPDKVPVAVYDNLIETVRANLDTLYGYLELRRKALGVRSLHIYDCYVPITKTKRTKTKYDQAVETVCDALSPLGADYCRVLRKGLQGRWVDRYENKGKRSGAFSAGGYKGPPYILMNYKEETIDSAFALAHEAGHSMHTYYSARSQPFQYYDYSLFVAEVASTVNERLLAHYLLARAKDRRTRAYLINKQIDEIRAIVIRQTMFAEFEKTLHGLVEAGEPLTLESIRSDYRRLLQRYFGPDFVIDEPLTLEGLRIPHFYRAFYVYKYATGYSAAIALSEGLLHGGKHARDRYRAFLKAGGSKYPLEVLREAGVDLAKPEPVEKGMAHFRDLVDELQELV